MSVRSHETHRKELCPWTRSRSALATHLPCDPKVNFPKISPGLQLQSFRRAAAATCPGKHRLEAKASTSSIFVNNFLRSALFPAADEVATFGKQPGWKYQTAASRLRLSRKEIKHRLEICVRPCTRADFPPRRVLLLNVEPLLLGQRPGTAKSNVTSVATDDPTPLLSLHVPWKEWQRFQYLQKGSSRRLGSSARPPQPHREGQRPLGFVCKAP